MFPGGPALRIDCATQVPLDPTFPKSIFHLPWIIYLSAQHTAGVSRASEILTEPAPEGGLLMSATKERLDPTNPEHVRRTRILAETMIAQTGNRFARKKPRSLRESFLTQRARDASVSRLAMCLGRGKGDEK